MKRVLHLVRPRDRREPVPPAALVGARDRVVDLGGADPADVVQWAFEYDVVVVW